ncbi:hypothetical protein GEMRC1_007422 [Eukaryota sp. GEM-RC1]
MGVRGFFGLLHGAELQEAITSIRLSHEPRSEPLYFAIDLGNFKSIVHHLVPDFSDGWSPFTITNWFHDFIQTFNNSNVFFIFYSEGKSVEDALRKTSSTHNMQERLLAESRDPLSKEYKHDDPSSLILLLLLEALELNVSNPTHGNKLRLTKDEGDPYVAQCVASGEAYAVISNDSDFCFFPGCRLAFFKKRLNWKTAFEKIKRGQSVTLYIFDQSLFKNRYQMTDLELMTFAAMAGSDSTQHLVRDWPSSNHTHRLSRILSQFRNSEFQSQWLSYVKSNELLEEAVCDTISYYQKVGTERWTGVTYESVENVFDFFQEKNIQKFIQPHLRYSMTPAVILQTLS